MISAWLFKAESRKQIRLRYLTCDNFKVQFFRKILNVSAIHTSINTKYKYFMIIAIVRLRSRVSRILILVINNNLMRNPFSVDRIVLEF
jgi:hypothetical protein